MIEYTIQTHARARSLKIKISPKGEVIVVKPPIIPNFMIKPFVQQHMDWIERNLKKVNAFSAQNKPKNSVDIFGKTYQKKVEFSSKAKIGVVISGSDILINPVTDSKISSDKALEQFLKSTAEKYIVPRTHQLGKKMNISFNQITLRQQKTRWGSCSSQGNLNFNWRLVHCPPEVIDYVITHELAHRKQMNHSNKFWDIVRQYDPEYLKHRGWLKRQGMSLE
jgi:predicted metal-dependent hydrolase